MTHVEFQMLSLSNNHFSGKLSSHVWQKLDKYYEILDTADKQKQQISKVLKKQCGYKYYKGQYVTVYGPLITLAHTMFKDGTDSQQFNLDRMASDLWARDTHIVLVIAHLKYNDEMKRYCVLKNCPSMQEPLVSDSICPLWDTTKTARMFDATEAIRARSQIPLTIPPAGLDYNTIPAAERSQKVNEWIKIPFNPKINHISIRLDSPLETGFLACQFLVLTSHYSPTYSTPDLTLSEDENGSPISPVCSVFSPDILPIQSTPLMSPLNYEAMRTPIRDQSYSPKSPTYTYDTNSPKMSTPEAEESLNNETGNNNVQNVPTECSSAMLSAPPQQDEFQQNMPMPSFPAQQYQPLSSPEYQAPIYGFGITHAYNQPVPVVPPPYQEQYQPPSSPEYQAPIYGFGITHAYNQPVPVVPPPYQEQYQQREPNYGYGGAHAHNQPVPIVPPPHQEQYQQREPNYGYGGAHAHNQPVPNMPPHQERAPNRNQRNRDRSTDRRRHSRSPCPCRRCRRSRERARRRRNRYEERSRSRSPRRHRRGSPHRRDRDSRSPRRNRNGFHHRRDRESRSPRGNDRRY
uniref:Protein grainyhead n=1 Tax=Caenorhabditis tropicalis TaxID=1561998 RepID=A0A1I7TZ86_9PELO